MPQIENPKDGLVNQAATLAQDIGPDIASVLITHYIDRDTLDTLRPEETDLATIVEMNRAVATELAAQGVEIFVQKADKAAFRRWMHEREDTPENRRSWVDRANLIRGAEAFRILGLPAPDAPHRPKFAAAPGATADRLLAAFEDEESLDFVDLTQALLTADRNDVFDLAVRKLTKREGEEATDALETALLETAEAGKLGPSGWAELVALLVALPANDVPDAGIIGDSFVGARIVKSTLEIRFLPGWRNPDTLAKMSPGALRRVLQDLVVGVEPGDLPPGDTDDLAKHGFGVLIGLQIDWEIPIWDVIVANGLPATPDDDEETPEQVLRTELFDGWRAAMFDAHQGCVPLALVSPSEVDAEIADFLNEAGQHTNGIDEIREFVAVARSEAGREDIVCRPDVIDDALKLLFYTESGRFLDSMTLSADRMPVPAEDMAQFIESLVRVVKDVPGR